VVNSPAPQAVQRALGEVREVNARGDAPSIGSEVKRLLDAVLDRTIPASDKPALLFLLAYKAENPNWILSKVPTGWRPADKVLCTALTEMNLTLHGNITAYGENMGIKGDAAGYNLFGRKRLGDALKYLEAHPPDVLPALRYVAWRFRRSYRAPVKIAALSPKDLTYTRALAKAAKLVVEESGGHFPQFLVAGLLRAFHLQWGTGRDVATHHPHAADTSDRFAGDIEEVDEDGQVLDAYEVTVRPDWKNRRPDLLKKMRKFSLSRYTVVCLIQPQDPDLSSPAARHRYMAPLGQDIAVVDIRAFVESLLTTLTRENRAAAFRYLEEYIQDRDLCGIPDLVDKLKRILEE
jgi:hypothetical protein